MTIPQHLCVIAALLGVIAIRFLVAGAIYKLWRGRKKGTTDDQGIQG